MKQIHAKRLLALALCLCASGCAGSQKPKEYRLIKASPKEEPEQAPLVELVAVPYAQPVPAQARPYPRAQKPAQGKQRRTKKELNELIAKANENAAQVPQEEGYFNAIQTYDFMAGALYQVYGAPNHLTMISFGPGEKIISFAAGDTVRWIVEETFSGAGQALRRHLLVQPVRASLHTTLVVTTDRGTYLLELKSFQHDFMAAVQFRYPQRLVRQRQQALQKERQAARAKDQRLKLAVDLEKLESGYQLVVEDRDNPPTWRPLRVFHDGKRTYIEFPRLLSRARRPALFVLSRSKKPQIVQYQVRGRYYVVPQIIELAQLRLGAGEGGDVVGIELVGGGR